MKFEKGLYAESLSIIRESYVMIFVFTIGGLIFTGLSELEGVPGAALIFPETIFWAILAYYVHSFVLFPSRSADFTFQSAFQTFYKRALMLSLISIALVIVLVIVAYFGFGIINSADEQRRVTILTSTALLTLGVITAIMFPMLGTWLPAAVVEDGTGIKEAFRRGRSTYWWTFIRLIFGPGLVIFAQLILLVTVEQYFGLDGKLYTSIRDFDAPAIALCTTLQIANCFATITFAVVLSRAYLRATSSDSKDT